jgi:hypothetical protein
MRSILIPFSFLRNSSIITKKLIYSFLHLYIKKNIITFYKIIFFLKIL